MDTRLSLRKIVILVFLGLHAVLTLAYSFPRSELAGYSPVLQDFLASIYRQRWRVFSRVDRYYWRVQVFDGATAEPLYCSCRPGSGNRERSKVVNFLRYKMPPEHLRTYAEYWAKTKGVKSIRLKIDGIPLGAQTGDGYGGHPVTVDTSYDFTGL